MPRGRRNRARGRGNPQPAVHRGPLPAYITGDDYPSGPPRVYSARARDRFEEKSYLPKEIVHFTGPESWATRADTLNNDTKAIMFAEGCTVTDEHLDTLVALGPEFCTSIRSFQAGGITSGGIEAVTEAAVARLAAAMPSLVEMSLLGRMQLGDTALLALLEHCPRLELIDFSAHRDRQTIFSGPLQGRALRRMCERPELGEKLVELRLVNQHMTKDKNRLEKAVRALSNQRKTLSIKTGSPMVSGLTVWLDGKQLTDANFDDWQPPRFLVDILSGDYEGLDVDDYEGLDFDYDYDPFSSEDEEEYQEIARQYPELGLWHVQCR